MDSLHEGGDEVTKSRGINKPKHRWTAAQVAAVVRDYPHVSTKKLAESLGVEIYVVYKKAQDLKLKKTEVYYLASPDSCRLRRGDNIGAAYRFKPGLTPFNKGLRRPGWGPGRMKETQFQKGQRSGVAVRLYKPIGTERLSKDGYLERKVNDGLPPQRRWRAVHLIVWEAAHGPLPPGHAVCFKQGRKSAIAAEITIDALYLSTRRDLMRRNTVHNLPKELARVVQLRGAVNRQINKRARNEKQDRRSSKSPV
jgi:hypothetical protein